LITFCVIYGKLCAKTHCKPITIALQSTHAADVSYFMKGNIMRFNPETKTFKVFTALYNGETLTPATAAKRFGVKNLSAEVSRVRHAGYCVYANTRKAGNGVTVTEYSIGTPSRKLISAGYKALALGIVA
jgi:hypothetical protein